MGRARSVSSVSRRARPARNDESGHPLCAAGSVGHAALLGRLHAGSIIMGILRDSGTESTASTLATGADQSRQNALLTARTGKAEKAQQVDNMRRHTRRHDSCANPGATGCRCTQEAKRCRNHTEGAGSRRAVIYCALAKADTKTGLKPCSFSLDSGSGLGRPTYRGGSNGANGCGRA